MTQDSHVRNGSPDGCGFLSPAEVEQALAGRLPDGRRGAFERHVEGGCGPCALLAADLDVFIDAVREGPSETERAEFDLKSPMLEARLRRGTPSTPTASYHWRWAAAAAVLVIALGTLVIQLSRSPATTIAITLPGGGELVAEAMAFSPPPTLRGSPTAIDVWVEAGRAYREGRFDVAAAQLDQIEPDDPSASDAALYRGVSLLMVGEDLAALEALAAARAIADEQDLPTGTIDWFSALAALALGDASAAKHSLAGTIDSGGAYSAEARELLDRL